MSRPKPTVLLEAINKHSYKAEQVLEADAIYSVFFEGKPINLRSLSTIVSYPGSDFGVHPVLHAQEHDPRPELTEALEEAPQEAKLQRRFAGLLFLAPASARGGGSPAFGGAPNVSASPRSPSTVSSCACRCARAARRACCRACAGLPCVHARAHPHTLHHPALVCACMAGPRPIGQWESTWPSSWPTRHTSGWA